MILLLSFLVAIESALAASDEEAAPEAPQTATPLWEQLRPKARILWRVRGADAENFARRYQVQQARLGAEFASDAVRAEIEADLTETSLLQDAFLEIRQDDWARVRVGRFKEPFSAMRLWSGWELPIPGRGSLVDAVGDLGFGGRNLGAQTSFRAKSLGRLEAQAGVFEGTSLDGKAPPEKGFFRLTGVPLKGLRLGWNVAKVGVFAGGETTGYGADVLLRSRGFTVLVEGLWAEDASRDAFARGVTGFVSRRWGVTGDAWIEPAIGGEYARTSGETDRPAAAWAVGAGFRENLLLRLGMRHEGSRLGDTTFVLQAGAQL